MKFPAPLKITSRKSTISNVFVQAIIPFNQPSPQEYSEALAHLGMTPETVSCCYCGDKATDWDHLRPLVKGGRPTGYVSDFKNLVPSCAPCNQSKSGADWETWMIGAARRSPASRKVPDLDERINRLKSFVGWGMVEPIDIEALAEPELLDRYFKARDEIVRAMQEAQVLASQIRSHVCSRMGIED